MLEISLVFDDVFLLRLSCGLIGAFGGGGGADSGLIFRVGRDSKCRERGNQGAGVGQASQVSKWRPGTTGILKFFPLRERARNTSGRRELLDEDK